MAKTQVIHLDCITAPNDGLNPSVILTACRAVGSPLAAQYVFNVPDAVSRFCLEHKLRPGLGLRGVFVTGTNHELHGLPGLVMRLRGDGQGAFELFGPGGRGGATVSGRMDGCRNCFGSEQAIEIDGTKTGRCTEVPTLDGAGRGRALGTGGSGGCIEQYVRSMPNICSWKAPAVLVNDFGERDSGAFYEDEHVRIWPLWDGVDMEAPEAFTAPSQLSRADVLEQLRGLAPARSENQHALFGRRYRKCGDVTHGDVWVREGRDSEEVGGRDTPLLGYGCFIKSADEVVVISGYADDVGTRLDTLLQQPLIQHCLGRWKDGTNESDNTGRVPLTVVISAVGGHTRGDVAQETSIRLITLPVVGTQMGPDNGVLGFDSTAKTAARLHVLCPHMFPAPHAWKNLQEKTEASDPDSQPGSGSFRVTLGPSRVVEGSERANRSAVYVPYLSDCRISSKTELEERCQKAAEFLQELEDDERQELVALREKIREDAESRRMLRISDKNQNETNDAPANNQSAAAMLRQRLLGGTAVHKRKRDTAGDGSPTRGTAPTTSNAPLEESTGPINLTANRGTTACDLVAPYVLFLGTGSAEPSKYRGPSGILVKIPYMNDDYVLMECGEGTFGQLVRTFGYSGAMDRLAKLRCIWISHRHADHISGLVELLSRRSQCTSLKEPELLILGPKACVRWVRSLQSSNVNLGRIQVEHFATAHGSSLFRHVQQRMNVQIICTPVHHCHDAFAVTFVFRTRGNRETAQRFKLVYSGDTEPCEALVRDAQGADLMIHEATFEPEMVRDARSKKHSTIQEALDVARRAGASRVILTHFSQRYPKFPKLDTHELERGGVGVAFDGFATPLETGGDQLSKFTGFVANFFNDDFSSRDIAGGNLPDMISLLRVLLVGKIFACLLFRFSPTLGATILFRTAFGPIPVALDDDNAPTAAKALLDAAHRRAKGRFERAEPRPHVPDDPEGPYALLQGQFDDDLLNLPREGKTTSIQAGDLVFIPNTPSFYIALESHDAWASAHTVIGRATRLSVVDTIVIQSTHEFIHPDYRTKMLMLNDSVNFKLTPDLTEIAMVRQ